MIGEYSTKKCPKCGSKMIIKNEKKTFDGIIEDSECEKCGYENNLLK